MASRRHSGAIRKLPSGRWQARVRDIATGQMVPLGTFQTKGDADLAVKSAETGMVQGGWVDPARGRVTLDDYSSRWLLERTSIGSRSREIYAGLLKVHVRPALGMIPLGRLDPGEVRRWHATLLRGSSPKMAPKAYRLLRSILATAVDDEVIVKNPCRIRGAGVERSSEQRVASLPQLYAVADAVPDRYRAACAPRRPDRPTHRRALRADAIRCGPPPSDGVGTQATYPARLRPGRDVTAEDRRRPQNRRPSRRPDARARAAPGRLPGSRPDRTRVHRGRGAALDRTNLRQRVWLPAVREVGVDGLRFHDLRHTAATLAATTGAITKELMARLGHASPRAALIYQHATDDRDRAIAAALTGLVEGAGLASVTTLPTSASGV